MIFSLKTTQRPSTERVFFQMSTGDSYTFKGGTVGHSTVEPTIVSSTNLVTRQTIVHLFEFYGRVSVIVAECCGRVTVIVMVIIVAPQAPIR
jgi:hypothetical protein